MRSLRVLVVLALVAVFATGCTKVAKPGQKPTFPVRGQVLVNDQPAGNARVVFIPANGEPDERRPTCFCKEDGTFEMSTYEARDGAPEGEYTVLIEWRPQRPDSPREQGPDKLSGKFFDPKTATLKLTVRNGKNDLEPFRLTLPNTAAAPAKPNERG